MTITIRFLSYGDEIYICYRDLYFRSNSKADIKYIFNTSFIINIIPRRPITGLAFNVDVLSTTKNFLMFHMESILIAIMS